MSEVLRNLEENLKRQVALYEELYDLERGKQKALIENNLQRIEAITAQQERIVHTTNSLEKERLLWSKQIGLELGKEPEDLTLAELADYFPVLHGVRSDLDRVVSQLQEIHTINTQLLRQAIKIVEFTVGLFTHQTNNIYTHPSRKEDDKKRHLLDRSV